MLVNKTQRRAHAQALKNLHTAADTYLTVIDDPHSMSVDVSIENSNVSAAVAKLKELNELMDHTADESEFLRLAMQQWIEPHDDQYRIAEELVRFSAAYS